jgi:hypothetical protein
MHKTKMRINKDREKNKRCQYKKEMKPPKGEKLTYIQDKKQPEVIASQVHFLVDMITDQARMATFYSHDTAS